MNLLKFFVIGLMSIATTPLVAAPTDDFVTTWKTDNYGTSNSTSITVPMIGGPYDVDWDNDGVFDQFGITDTVTHDFGVAGTYTIRIFGSYDSIRFEYDYYFYDAEKLLSLDQWGTASWTSMGKAFSEAVNLLVPATDTPDFSAVTDMSYMFNNAYDANPDASGWNTSSVTRMGWMFQKRHLGQSGYQWLGYLFGHQYVIHVQKRHLGQPGYQWLGYFISHQYGRDVP